MLVSFLPLLLLGFVGPAALTLALEHVCCLFEFETVAFQEAVAVANDAFFFVKSMPCAFQVQRRGIEVLL